MDVDQSPELTALFNCAKALVEASGGKLANLTKSRSLHDFEVRLAGVIYHPAKPERPMSWDVLIGDLAAKPTSLNPFGLKPNATTILAERITRRVEELHDFNLMEHGSLKPPSRVTPEAIEEEIASEHYFTALDGVQGERGSTDGYPGDIPDHAALSMLTFCVLLLRNGYKVVGVNHGPVDPANFDAEYGRRDARKDAIRQVWPLLGFRLRDQLASEKPIERSGHVPLARIHAGIPTRGIGELDLSGSKAARP